MCTPHHTLKDGELAIKHGVNSSAPTSLYKQSLDYIINNIVASVVMVLIK